MLQLPNEGGKHNIEVKKDLDLIPQAPFHTAITFYLSYYKPNQNGKIEFFGDVIKGGWGVIKMTPEVRYPTGV